MNYTDKLSEVRDELRVARDRGRLTNDGAVLLRAIESPMASGGFGALLQGLSLNLSDEAIGTVRSLFSDVPETVASGLTQIGVPTSPRQAGVAIEQLGLREYGQEYPARSIGLELTGGMIPALASRGRTAPESITMATGKAAGLGGISGFGAAEGGFGERAESGVAGAVISGVATPILQTGGKLVGRGYRGAVDAMFSSPQRLGKDAARNAVREALESDVGSVDEALQVILSKQGKPYTLADVGPNTRAYIDAANTLPGPGKKEAQAFLAARDKGSLARITSDIQEAFGADAGFFDEFNALKIARQDTGKNLYGKAFQVQVPVTTEFTSLMTRPSIVAALDRAKNIAAERGVKLPDVRIENGKLLTKDGEVKAIDTELMHYIKMGLDDLVFTGKSPTSGIGATQLGSIKETRARLLNYIDRNNPSYKQARNYWADDTAAMDAMQAGRNFFRADYDEMAADVRRMSESEKEAFRIGAMQQVMDRIGGAQVGQTVTAPVGSPARNLLKDPKNVRLMRLTFPEGKGGQQQFDRFISKLNDEVEMRTTSQVVLAGSQTAGRQEAVGRLREEAKRELPRGASVADLILGALRRDFQGVEQQQLMSTANEIVRTLTETNPQKLQQIAQELQGSRAIDVFRRTAPELLPTLGRAALGPYAISALSGSAAPGVSQAMPGLLNLFGQ